MCIFSPFYYKIFTVSIVLPRCALSACKNKHHFTIPVLVDVHRNVTHEGLRAMRNVLQKVYFQPVLLCKFYCKQYCSSVRIVRTHKRTPVYYFTLTRPT